MNLFDRYTGKQISEMDLPDKIDFGRYSKSELNKNPIEITYSNFPTKKLIHQDLLLEKNKSFQDNFLDIKIEVDNSKLNEFNVIPLIRRIKNKLYLNEFEKLLNDKIFHLEEIFRQPHYLLKQEIEKVHVSRSKRIPSKSYQYLASHTEDWIHKSIVKFMPYRILNEELELDYNIYENQLIVTFVERSLIYLNSRIKEIQDLKSFLKEYELLIQNRKDEKGWYKKINRNLKLIGAVYEDEHYHGENLNDKTLSHTADLLNQINKRLQLLRKSELFNIINKRTIQNIVLRNTNVLVNHKHYRYLKSLWLELEKIKPIKSEQDKLENEQFIFEGLVSYAISLFAYCLKEFLNFNISGNYDFFECEHLHLPKIKFSKDTNGILNLSIGEKTLRFIVIANEPSDSENIEKILVKNNTYLLYFSENLSFQNNRLININPLDPDSTERLGSLLTKYLLYDYLSKLNTKYEFKHLLRDYTHYITNKFIEIDKIKFCYWFKSFPQSKINLKDYLKQIEEDINFKTKKSKIDKKNIIKEATELVNEINLNSEKIKSLLYCFNCGEELISYTNTSLNYIKCSTCSTLINNRVTDKVILSIDKQQQIELQKSDFGMDYLEFNPSDL